MTGRAARAALAAVCAACIAVLGSLPLSVSAQGGPHPADAPAAGGVPGPLRPNELPAERVVVGDTGHGVTAGPGNALERFDVEVLGVQYGAGNGFPLVLIRATGPLIDASGGVAAGMSGSPVHIVRNGVPALLGAVAYVFPEADHELALVTPIAAMRQAAGGHGAAAPSSLEVAGVGTAVPAASPLLLSGATARAAAMLSPLLGDGRVHGLPAQAGAGAPAELDDAYELAPGSAVGVALITGDVQLAAVGTVTTVEGDELLAFGHPFLGLGAVSLPLVPAHVTAIVPSSQAPFKLANVGTADLGEVNQDRATAVAATVGGRAADVPVTLTLLGVGDIRSYEFRVAADERLLAPLTATAALTLVDRALGATVGGYAEVGWEIGLRDGSRLNVLEQLNDEDDVAWATANLVGAPLAILAENPFREPGVEHVAVTVRVDTDRRSATLDEAILERDEVPQGESVHIHVRLQPYRRQAVVRTLTVPLPDDLVGDTMLIVRGASEPRDTGDTDVDEREIDPPRSFGELKEALRAHTQAKELVVEAVSEDGELSRLLRLEFPWVVTGQERVWVYVTPPDDGAEAPQEEEEP